MITSQLFFRGGRDGREGTSEPQKGSGSEQNKRYDFIMNGKGFSVKKRRAHFYYAKKEPPIPGIRQKSGRKESENRTQYLVKLRKIQTQRGLLLHPLGNVFKIGSVFQRQNGEDSSINKIDSMID